MPDLKSPILSLPYIAAAQAQKHVTHNEALAQLDVLVQLSVVGFDALTPPASPEDGAVHALADGATGVWAGQAAGTLAAYLEGAWAFAVPKAGWIAGSASGEVRSWDGTAWTAVGGGSISSVATLGINATADAINRLSLNAEATLLNHAGAGHQLKINKNAPTDTASLLFQTDFGGRAEMGTAGSDDFSVKVSADGAAWFTAMEADAATGLTEFPSGARVANDIPVAGRWTITDTQDWVGFPTAWGANSGNYITTFGNGPQPNGNWSDIGLPVSKGMRLLRLEGLARSGSSQVTSLDIRVVVHHGQSGGAFGSNAELTKVTVGSVDAFATPGTGFMPLSLDMGGFEMPEDGILQVYMRGNGSITANRVAWLSTVVKTTAL